MLISSYASSRPDRIVWPDRKWEWAALVSDNGDFETNSGIDIQARDHWFSQATGAVPSVFAYSYRTSLADLSLKYRLGEVFQQKE